MKKALMWLVFILIMTGCANQRESTNGNLGIEVKSISEDELYMSAITADVVAQEPSNQNIKLKNANNEGEDTEYYGVRLSNSSNDRTEKKYSVIVIENLIPTVPEGYEGTVVNYTMPYTGKDGIETERTYENVAFVEDCDNKYLDYNKYFIISEMVNINGKQVAGFFICERELLYFLGVKGEEGRIYLDVKDIPDTYEMEVLACNNETILIRDGSYAFTYSFKSKECRIITDSICSFLSPVEDNLFYTDWEHDEHVVDWRVEGSELKKTGKKVVTYLYEGKLQPIENEQIQKDFQSIQQYVKSGDQNSIAQSGYKLYNDDLYDENFNYLGNIHLPFACNNSGYAVYDSLRSCFAVNNVNLMLYRYGETVRKYTLKEGDWRIIDRSIILSESIAKEENTTITAEKLKKLISKVDVLLYNKSDSCLYHLSDANGETAIDLIANDVKDCFAKYDGDGFVYWMDSKGNAYELHWKNNGESILIGQNAVGIMKENDGTTGFIVKRGDTRCNYEDRGFHYCTQYGRGWLNQEKTNEAWALQFDWSE